MNNEEQYARLELGKTYNFMGYKWTVCQEDTDQHVIVIQSHGITAGTWPGFKIKHFGDGECYEKMLMARISMIMMRQCKGCMLL